MSNANAAASVCDAASGGNTTDNDADNHADADADVFKTGAADGAATDTNADDDSCADILMNLRKTSVADDCSASAANSAAVNAAYTVTAFGNSTDNVNDVYADADADAPDADADSDNAKAAAAVGDVAAHVDCKIKGKCTLMNRTKTEECMTMDNTTTNKRKTMNCAMIEDTTMEKRLSDYQTIEDHMTMDDTMMNCTTMDDHTMINPEYPTMEDRMTMNSTTMNCTTTTIEHTTLDFTITGEQSTTQTLLSDNKTMIDQMVTTHSVSVVPSASATATDVAVTTATAVLNTSDADDNGGNNNIENDTVYEIGDGMVNVDSCTNLLKGGGQTILSR
jgi:hypothetical protein